MSGGRPIRFLALTLGGWTAIRVAALWPDVNSVPSLIRAVAPPAFADTLPAALLATNSGSPAAPQPKRAGPAFPERDLPPATPQETGSAAPLPLAAAREQPTAAAAPAGDPGQPPPLRLASLARAPGRLAGSIWAILRDGPVPDSPGSQLGGSQLGARFTYALGQARRVALAARASAPVHGRGAELAVGLDWQPAAALPVHLIAEQRLAVGGGRGGPALMLVGGLDPRSVVAGFRLEAYGQAGVVARDRADGFVDGAVRLTRPVARLGAARLDLGAGTWGGAQRGAARLDIGPSAAVALPVGGHYTRIALDWRQRIAGDARPGSGPALSIGSDF